MTMKKAMLMAILAVTASAAMAADRTVMLPIAAAMAANDAQAKLEPIKFYFAGEKTPKILEKKGSDKTSQKTNAFAKSDATACNWAFLSSMLSLQKRAIALGANAVVNITNNYGNVANPNPTEFECHAGGIMAGVALKGDFVRIDAPK
jgi:hypothetical protein